MRKLGTSRKNGYLREQLLNLYEIGCEPSKYCSAGTPTRIEPKKLTVLEYGYDLSGNLSSATREKTRKQKGEICRPEINKVDFPVKQRSRDGTSLNLIFYPTEKFTWVFRNPLGGVSTFKFSPTLGIPFLFFSRPRGIHCFFRHDPRDARGGDGKPNN